ncbi:hypothetical protein ONS96_013434 [Cadophora gregata f. sp. sojae]|nr:hypothetical protein ONS96_013434 [Cadophora gregata f. sp. sojae]
MTEHHTPEQTAVLTPQPAVSSVSALSRSPAHATNTNVSIEKEKRMISNAVTISTNSSPSTTAATTFPLFPKLPLELRLKIFRHATNSLKSNLIHIKAQFSSIAAPQTAASGGTTHSFLRSSFAGKKTFNMSFTVSKSGDAEHDASVRDIGLSRAYFESRGV